MKKSVFCLSVLICIVLVGVMFFNHTENERIPDKGIYWILQNSYYCVGEGEEISLAIDCFVVGDCEQQLEDLAEIAFLDKSGEEYIVNNKEYEVIYDGNVGYMTNGIAIEKFVINLNIIPAESVIFGKIKYVENNKSVIQEIGKIQIECLENKEDILAIQNRISWVTITQPTFNHAEYIIENKTKEKIEIVDISYGDSQINVDKLKTFVINGFEEKEQRVNISLAEEDGNPIVYYMKPSITYKTNDSVRKVSFSNISKEAYYGDVESIREYLYQISKGEK